MFDAEVIKQLVPFGIGGLGIAAIVTIAVSPINKTNKNVIMIAMGLIVVLAIFDKLNPIPTLQPLPNDVKIPSSTNYIWTNTGSIADWAGRDVAYSAGNVPKSTVKDLIVCDAKHLNAVATCWDQRPDGYPIGTTTDVVGNPAAWCTYKNNSINISTPPDGKAPKGRVYICTFSSD